MTLHLDDGWQVHDLGQLHVSPVAPGKRVDGLAFLPFVVREFAGRVPVRTVVVAPVFAVAALPPPVIGYHHVLKKHTNGSLVKRRQMLLINKTRCG